MCPKVIPKWRPSVPNHCECMTKDRNSLYETTGDSERKTYLRHLPSRIATLSFLGNEANNKAGDNDSSFNTRRSFGRRNFAEAQNHPTVT